MTDATERWLPIVGYDGRYEVSDFGRVKSLLRYDRWRGTHVPRNLPLLLATHKSPEGYPVVTLVGADGSKLTKTVHVQVLLAFVGPRPSGGFDASHIDGTRDNNRLPNLTWETRAENFARMNGHGTKMQGGSHYNTEFNEKQVSRMRWLHSVGVTVTELTAIYGAKMTTIYAIVSGQNWKQAQTEMERASSALSSITEVMGDQKK